MDHNFTNPGYLIACYNDQMYLSKITMNLNKFAVIADYFHDIHSFAIVDTLHVSHVSENIEDINLIFIK